MAHFVRGQWLRALQVHPGVFVLAVASLLFIPWSWASSWRGQSVAISRPWTVCLWIVFLICTVTMVHWTAQILAG